MNCIWRSIVVTTVVPGTGSVRVSSPLEIGRPSADSSAVRSPGVPASWVWYWVSSPEMPLPSTSTSPSTCGASEPAG